MSLKQPGLLSVSTTTTTGTYKDLADFNFAVDSWTDALTGPLRDYVEGTRPGRIDTARLDEDPRYKPGDLTVNGTVISISPSYTMADFLTDLRNLKGWCARAVAVKFPAIVSDAFLQVRLLNATVTHFDSAGKVKSARVALTFRAHDPLWYSTSETSNTITGSLSQQALGTAPVRPVITVTGNPSALTLTYANSADATVKTLVFSGLVTSSVTALAIDMSRLTAIQTISGTPADAVGKITSGDFFALDPADSDTVTPTWCKLSYTATGTVTNVACVYRKAYW